MNKRVLSFILVLCLIAGLFSAMSVSAFAEGDTIEVTIKGGDTIIGICGSLGLNYFKCKAAILKLNGFTSDAIFNNLKAGQVVVFPTSDANAAKIASDNYVVSDVKIPEGSTVTVTIKGGDTVYALCKNLGYSYGTYKALILKLNHLESEAKFNNLKAGNTVILPASEAAAIQLASANSSAANTSTADPSKSVAQQAAANNLVSGTIAFNLVPYKIKSGDTLYNICNANKVSYAANKDLILKINNMSSAAIKAGASIYLPSSVAPTSGSYYQVLTHVISAGETTYMICQRYGVNYGKMKSWLEALNTETNLNSLKVGKTLLIPVAATGKPSSGTNPTNQNGTVPQATYSGQYAIRFEANAVSSSTATVRGMVASTANKGDVVNIACTGANGYTLESITVVSANGTVIPVTNNSFVMPDSAVTITAKYVSGGSSNSGTSTQATAFKVYSGEGTGNVIANAKPGETVTFTPSPASGYSISSVTVTGNGNTVGYKTNSDGSYSFTMPSYDVHVVVKFIKN